MLRLITAAALGLAALVAVPAAAGGQAVERQTTVVQRGPHGGERVVTRTTVRRSSYGQRRAYGRPRSQRPGYGAHRAGYGRPAYRAYGRPRYHAYGRRCWTSWYHGRAIRHCR